MTNDECRITNPAGQSSIVNRQSSIPLRVLLIEDSEDDARLVLRALTQAGYQPDHLRVQAAENLKQALAARQWDVILSDYVMPGFTGSDALEILKQSGLDLPFIIVSGAVGEDTAVALMKAGAHDYVMKDKLSRLAPVIARELDEALSRRERRRAETALRESEERYRTLAETARDFIYMVGSDARIEYVNSTAAAELGHNPAEIIGKALSDLFPQPVAEREWHNVKTVFDTGTPLYLQNRSEFPRRELWLDTWLAPVRDEQGKIRSVVGISRNVTELVQIELALRTSEERYRLLFERAPIGIYRTTPDGRILMANPALIRMMGYSSFYELSLRNLDAESFQPSYDRGQFLQAIDRTGEILGLESEWFRRDGTPLYIRENARAYRDPQGKTLYYEGTIEDITDQRRIQGRLTRLNAVLRAVRSISQLITRETQPEPLIQQTCRLLVQSRGYQYAWIALFQPQATSHKPQAPSSQVAVRSPQFLTASHSGFDAEFPDLAQRLKAGDLPPCVTQALALSGAIPRDPACSSQSAVPSSQFAVHSSEGLIARLEHESQIYGVLAVACPPGIPADTEEQTLLSELAADLAFALHACQIQQQRFQTAAALLKSETRYREIFERALDVIYVHDLQGRFLAINPAGEQLLGYTQDQLRNMTIAQVVDPGSLPLVRKNMQDKIEGKSTQTAYELLVRTRTGQTCRVELVSRVVTENGKPVAIQGHARDITQRRAAELASRQSEQRYRSLVELSPDAIIVHLQGKIAYANPAALRLARAETQNQLVGKSLLDFVHPDYRELVTQRVKAMSAKGIQVPLTEEKFLRLDGSVIDVEVAAMPITYPASEGARERESKGASPNSVSAILVVFRDVTDRKQADNALRQSEARYRLLFEATPIGIAVFHPDGAIIAVNQFMQDLSGYAYPDFKQLGIGAIFLDPDERNRLFEATNRKPPVTSDEPQAAGLRNWEMRLRRKDGSTCYALLNVDRLEVGASSILLATARDITDRKNAELRLLRLNQLYAVLSQANQAFVRERDIQRLCQEACRILVQAGGYRLAWVGIVDQDRRQLKPIARSGDDHGYVDRLRIFIDRPGAHGPSTTALREGHPIVWSDLEAAPRDMPPHAEAAEQGFRAVAAFPLRVSDEIIGAISIYAAEPDYFDAEQVRLLEALAADLSFAIQSAQLEEYRRAKEAQE
jgi:PAS domain S-box-containing protein